MIQSDVKKYALEKGLRILQPERLKDETFVSQLKEINADLFIVIAFRMLPEGGLGNAPSRHIQPPRLATSKYRGAAPINWAVINGEKETGVTTFFLKHEIDTGDIIQQKKIDIAVTDNVGAIHDRLMELGAGMVIETVDDIINDSVTTIPQDALIDSGADTLPLRKSSRTHATSTGTKGLSQSTT